MIFICDYDPFGKKKYMYNIENCCIQSDGLSFDDGSHTICLSTRGENEEKVSEELVRFLEYVGADLEASTGNFEDGFVSRLQESVRHVKASRKMEERYMLFEELLRNERKEGKAEGKAESILELLAEAGNVPAEVSKRIYTEGDAEKLRCWLKLAARAESVEQFVEVM